MEIFLWVAFYFAVRYPIPTRYLNVWYAVHYVIMTGWFLILKGPLGDLSGSYYLAQLAFYCSSLVYLIDTKLDGDRKEYTTLALHHLLTVGLVAISLAFPSFHGVGLRVMFLHDVTDIFLFGSKAAHERHYTPWNVVLFGAFAATFLVLRLVVLPIWVIWPCWMEVIPATGAYHSLGGLLCVTGLTLLYGLHWWWWQRIAHILRKAWRGEDLRDEQ